ncbi:MAG TPA: heme exporter protein CcmD [Caulobacteraceae bacterium]|nr:heme exporter protein CcmD [Caulobacteraceae bacterium]
MSAMFDFDAGRYGAYVWPAYAATAIVIAFLVIDSLWRARRWKRAAEGGERAP